MGRGRAKAKQTKVARELKYRTHDTDFGALAQELQAKNAGESESTAEDDPDDWSESSESNPD